MYGIHRLVTDNAFITGLLFSYILSSLLFINSSMPSIFIHDSNTMLPFTIKKKSSAGNQLRPILRIYPDLLQYIFILGANLESNIQRRKRTVISCSQTCHDWRAVAFSIKLLWSGLVDFEGNSEAWNRELLRRSYPYPIVVGCMAYALRSSRVISAELAHLERIRIYRVGFEASAWDILLERLQQPAPHIEYLNISHSVECDGADSFILPSTLFAGNAPRLKRLEMTQCLVDFQAPVLRSLTTLSVENLNALIAPTPLEWLEHLRRLPSLTSLRLVNSMRTHDHSTHSNSTSGTKLSLLSALHLVGSLHDIHMFIEGLRFPVSCGLMINCSKSYLGPELDVVLLAYLHRLDYAHHVLPENCPFFIYGQRSTLSIWNEQPFDDSTSHANNYDITKPSPPTLWLDLNLDPFEFGSWESLLTPVLYILQDSFSNFTSLQLQLPTIHPGLLPSLIRATKLTKLINVSATMTKKLLSLVQQQPSDSIQIPLPALHTIVFNDDESMWGIPYRTFISFLTWRRDVGYPIERVQFRRCLVLEDRVISLGSLGVEVDCDSEGLRWERL